MNVSVAEATRIITYVRAQPLGPFVGSTPAFMDPPSIDPPPDADYPGTSMTQRSPDVDLGRRQRRHDARHRCADRHRGVRVYPLQSSRETAGAARWQRDRVAGLLRGFVPQTRGRPHRHSELQIKVADPAPAFGVRDRVAPQRADPERHVDGVGELVVGERRLEGEPDVVEVVAALRSKRGGEPSARPRDSTSPGVRRAAAGARRRRRTRRTRRAAARRTCGSSPAAGSGRSIAQARRGSSRRGRRRRSSPRRASRPP